MKINSKTIKYLRIKLKKNEKEFNQNKRNWKMEFFYKIKGKKEGSTQQANLQTSRPESLLNMDLKLTLMIVTPT